MEPIRAVLEVTRMTPVLSAGSHPHGGAPRPFLYGLLALVSIGASIGTAQTGPTLTQRLDSIAGAGVRENRAVGIVAALVQGNDTLLLKAYGKAVVESDSPATVDTVFQIGSDTKQFTAAAVLQLRDQGTLTLDYEDYRRSRPSAANRAHRDLRRRCDLLVGRGPDRVVEGAARRQGADAQVVCRDDDAGDAQ